MMTVKQVAALTGVSVRTLQFYDEIGLLKPSCHSGAGYRLYDDSALEVLQQILFFKELDFTLKEIKEIMENPDFNRSAVLAKQRELIQMKRDRLTALLELLDKLIQGKPCGEFEIFDLSEYFRILNDFKRTHTDGIIAQFGSVEQFDDMISKLKKHESEIADQAIKQYGSLESYTNGIEKNLANLLTNGPTITQSEAKDLIKKTDAVTKKLTADLGKDPASSEVQALISELISFNDECNRGIDMGENYWYVMAEHYESTPVFITATDRKYGAGASKFIALALRAYLERQ